MSIKILPESEIKKSAKSFQAPALLFSNPKNLYERRIKRLQQLTENSPFPDYLEFASLVVESQLTALERNPLPRQDLIISDEEPLKATTFKRNPIWREYLSDILRELKPQMNPQVAATIDRLEKTADKELEAKADLLLAQEFEKVPSDEALFIWSALSLYWVQLAEQIPHHSRMDSSENLHYCPVCGEAPIASVVHFGAAQGLRYLHCALCESEWNLVRAQCTNCNQHGKMEMWSIDEELALVRAESCGDCQSYLKIMFQEKDPHVEPLADDLASLFLDAELEEKGFARSGLNPFMFPAADE